MSIHVKRVYEPLAKSDGTRILVDRLWPRGLTKEKAAVDHWARDLAPSTDLRKWYGHEHDRWDEFRTRYFEELEGSRAALDVVLAHVRAGTVTFLFSSREEQLNNAAALKEYVERHV